jgi:HD-GYP domain-containing protein (c-di-GMP phosphodiesterase class II)
MRDMNSLIVKSAKEEELVKHAVSLAAKFTASPIAFAAFFTESEWEIASSQGLTEAGLGAVRYHLKRLEGEGRLVPEKPCTLSFPPSLPGLGDPVFQNLLVVTFPIPERSQSSGVLGVANQEDGASYTVHRQWLLTYLAQALGMLTDHAKIMGSRSFFCQDTILALTHAMEARDPDINSRRRIVNQLAMRVAQRMGLGEHDRETLNLATMLYDIGMLSVPDRITLKQGGLGKDETDLMRTHVKEGVRVLSGLHCIPEEVIRVVETHHEQYSGKGYPAGLQGNQIPLCARIIHICVAYEAMTSNRPYRKGMSRETALGRLRESSGSQFDPNLVNLFVELVQGDAV